MGRELLLDARKTLIEEIRKELMGPGSEFSIPDEQHEIITDLPEVRYSVGILFQGNLYESDNNDSFTIREVTADIDTKRKKLQPALMKKMKAIFLPVMKYCRGYGC